MIDKLSNRELSIELLRSIRDIDIRLSELEILVNEYKPTAWRQSVFTRVDGLLLTRSKLIETFSIIPFDTIVVNLNKLQMEHFAIEEQWNKKKANSENLSVA